MPEPFEIYIAYKRRYINTLPFLSFLYLSVRLSATSLSSTKKTKPKITQTMPRDSPGILVF